MEQLSQTGQLILKDLEPLKKQARAEGLEVPVHQGEVRLVIIRADYL